MLFCCDAVLGGLGVLFKVPEARLSYGCLPASGDEPHAQPVPVPLGLRPRHLHNDLHVRPAGRGGVLEQGEQRAGHLGLQHGAH